MENIIQKMNELFITYRHSFIEQKADGSYSNISHYALNDSVLSQHLKGKRTIGLFSGKQVTKFVCFDVDTKDNAEIDTRHLLNVLVEDFNFNRNDLHVSVSGNKGYHVDIYFNKVISTNIVKRFYNDVINKAGFTTEQVELRPTAGQGLKLPLGVHKVTGNKCWYVNQHTFKPIENINHILTIEPISTDFFEIEYSDLEPIILEQQQAKEFIELTDSVTISTAEIEDNYGNINFVLENNHLRFPNTRNNMTLVLAMYLKGEGYTQANTINIIESIMLNTKKTLPDFIESSESRIKSQTKHIVKTTYKHDYKLSSRKKDVCITRDEILDILEIKEWHLKQLYLIHMIHSKRYAKDNGNYYMTYQTMANMGATNNRTRNLKNLLKLQELERLEIVAQNVFDTERCVAEGKPMSKPNVYKIKKAFNQNADNIMIKDEHEIKLENILNSSAKLLDIDLKTFLPRRQLDKVKKVG